MILQHFQKFALTGAIVLPLVLAADQAAPPTPPPTQPQVAAKKAPTKEELFQPESIDRLSLTYGHLIQKSLSNPIVKLNAQKVIEGIQDAINGKPMPISEKEYEQALNLMQQYAYEDMAKKNLQEAESYLEKNGSEPGIVTVEEGKLQYKVLQPGTGEVVTEETMPTINYSATYSNGQKLGSSEQTGGPIEVNLNETIPGFRKGIVGMKVGEKRELFIHPDLGYGKSGQLPNGLLIFEIEVTKVAPKPAKEADNDDDNDNDEDDLASLIDTDDLLADDDDDDDNPNDAIDEIDEIDIEETEEE